MAKDRDHRYQTALDFAEDLARWRSGEPIHARAVGPVGRLYRWARREPIRVNAPQTGAVGKLPVIRPGQVFEYMSGAELATDQGQMKGCFHLCRVPEDTRSAVVGMPVPAFDQEEERFEVTIHPFALRVPR